MSADGFLAEVAAIDRAALTAAADVAEEALACHRDALAALGDGWRSETGSAATDVLHQQCAEATDIVVALRRVAVELALLNDGWADTAPGNAEAVRPDGVRTAEPPVAEASRSPAGIPAADRFGAGTASPPGPPTVVPAETVSAAPGSAQAAGGPWSAAPTTAWQAPLGVPPAGSGAALPDLGGALVGLVAQIAQALGSYGDIPAAGRPEGPAETPPVTVKAEPRTPGHQTDPPMTAGAAPSRLPDGAVPKSAVVLPQPPVQAQPVPSPELLAAERPADPGVAMESAPPPVAAAVPDPPPPPAADVGTAPVGPADAKTPCEIAADELPKVGE